MTVIEVKNIVKEFKVIRREKGLRGSVKALFKPNRHTIKAVDDISFSIGKGEIVAYIGPNGAGKSTTVKMMSGILTPSSGEILINGQSPQKNRKRVVKDLGVVFGQRTQLNWDLRMGESFELLKRIYEIDEATYRENLSTMDEILGINALLSTPVRQLSLGQRMRGDLTAAMLHSPSVLFLDEPTIGLDVEAKNAIRRFIKDINQNRKTTIILTTHDLGDIQELCDRVIIINQGKVIEDGSLKGLIDKIAPYRHLIVDYYEENAQEHPKAQIMSVADTRTVYRFWKKDITAAQLIEDLSKIAKIKDVSLKEADIEDIISIAYRGMGEQ
ncbi:MAG: ATP-binding cassette domain-containing protein [Eubacteriales bacterium]